MALRLPRITVDLSGAAPQAFGDGMDLLTGTELADLLALDLPQSAVDAPVVDRVRPLSGRRWAVGRRTFETCVWRIVDEEASGRVGQPAWLWTRDVWFDPRVDADQEGPAPAVLPLRNLMAFCESLAGNRRATVKALASALAAVRSRHLDPTLPPVALVVPVARLTSSALPCRWFVLSLMTCLAPAFRERLRVGVCERRPAAGPFDLVLCARPPRGYHAIDLTEAPGEGTDLVAYYVRNRIYANDSEAAEAAAWLAQGTGRDAWGEAIAQRIRDGAPGVSVVTPERLKADPEGTVRALTARLQAGAALDEELMAALVQVTLVTRDPRPWAPVAKRPATERASAVQALLAQRSGLRPTGTLLRAIAGVYPPGADIEAWVEALMAWIRANRGTTAALTILEKTLLKWPRASSRANRASVWSEVVRSLVSRNRYTQAMEVAVGPLSRELAREGAGRALVGNWSAIPERARTAEQLVRLVDILDEAPDGGPAIAMLFRYVRSHAKEVHALVHRWAELRGTWGPDDPLFRAVRDSEYLGDWVQTAVADDTLDDVTALLQRVANGADDPIWARAEASLASAYADDPRGRFVALRSLAPGLSGLEPAARQVVGPALRASSFPDAAISEVAQALANVPGYASIWPWIALCAATPTQFDDPTIDATLVAFCQAVPETLELREAAQSAARRLGRADEWEPLDHARWLVRLCLAPDDGTGFPLALAVALAQGIAQRPDGVQRMAQVADALFDLPPDHAALLGFVHVLLPQAWEGSAPAALAEAVDGARVPAVLQEAWQQALAS